MVFPFLGAATCFGCPEGYMCTRQVAADLCRQGFYCHANTGYDIQPCPLGTYGASEGLKSEGECSNCTGGSYCNSPGLPAPTAECDPGFWCQLGVSISSPDTNSGHTGTGGKCFRGHECPKGTSYPQPCKNGYYSNAEGMEQCSECPEGILSLIY